MITSSWAHDLIKSNGFRIFKGQADNSPLSLEINKDVRFIRIGLQEYVSLNLEKILLLDENGNTVSDDISVIVSSAYEDLNRFNGEYLVGGSPTGALGFHSKNERSPWVVVDLKFIKRISKLIIYNRGDKKCYFRALSLIVEVSTNLTNWETTYNNLSYRKTQEYLSLPAEDKVLCDLAALQPNKAIQFRNALIRSKKKDEALTFLENANDILKPYKFSLGPHGLTQTFSIRTEKQMETVYRELSKFLSVLNDELQVSSFASSGTLLGFVRNGALLGHDDDLDVCYISNETSQDAILTERDKIIDILKEKGYSATHSGVAHLWINTSSGIGFDLFTGWQDGQRCIMNPLLNSGIDTADILPLKKINSHGVTIYIPNNPTPLMVLNYGQNWEKPDLNWRFDWSHAREQYGFLYLQ